MSKTIQWVKDSVDICVNFFSYEQAEAESFFLQLENKFMTLTYMEKQEIRKILLEQFTKEDLIYVLSFFVSYMDIKEFEDLLLDSIATVNYDCFTSIMLELQTYTDVAGRYEKKRIIHSKNVNSLEKEIILDYPYLNKNDRNKNRIVVITEQLLNENHAPTKAVLDYAVALKKLGYEVAIFVCPSSKKLPEGVWHRAIYMDNENFPKNAFFTLKYRDAVLDVCQMNMDEGGIEQYKRMIEFIYEFNPLFVYSMGLMNPIGDVMNRFTTVVARKYSLGLPLSQADVLVKIEDNNDTMEVYKCCCNQKIISEGRTMTYFDASDKCVSRNQFGLPEDGFLIAVVGNRLDKEIDDEFIQLLRKIVLIREDIYIAIIGKVNVAKSLFFDDVFDGHIHFLDYCPDLMSLYKVVDLYVNPKRYGGGYSALMALIAKVPVITLPDCDVAFNAGEEFVVQNYDEMYEKTRMLIIDANYYEGEKEKTLKFEKDYSFDNMVIEIEKNLNVIIEVVMT